MLELYIRPWCQRIFIDKVAAYVAKIVSPNVITLFSLLFGVTVPIFLYYHLAYLAIVALLLSGYCDSLDGSVARLSQLTSDVGAVFDIVCDRAVEFSVVLGLFFVDPVHRALLSILMLGAILICVSSFLVVGMFVENNSHKGFFYSRGLMERLEAFVFFIAMILFARWFDFLAITFSVLVLLTAVLRVYDFASFKTKELEAMG